MRDEHTSKTERSTWERPAMRRLDAADAEMSGGMFMESAMAMSGGISDS